MVISRASVMHWIRYDPRIQCMQFGPALRPKRHATGMLLCAVSLWEQHGNCTETAQKVLK